MPVSLCSYINLNVEETPYIILEYTEKFTVPLVIFTSSILLISKLLRNYYRFISV